MGFGVSNLLNKYFRPALISWDSYNGVEGGSINVDVKITEAHKFSNDVTLQTMEDGSIIDEHVINNPMEVSLQFEETNNTIFSGGILGSTSFKPSWMKFGPASTFEKLKQLSENKVPLTITTQHNIYENMIIKNMPILHSAPYRNRIQVACDLVQLNFATLQITSFKAITKAISKAVSSTVSGGVVKTQNVAQTILSNLGL